MALDSSGLCKGAFEHRCGLICPAQPRDANCCCHLSGLALIPPHPPSWPPPLPTLLSMKDNYLFLKEVKNLVEKTNCELKVCFQYMNRGDRWIQVRNPKLGRTWPRAQARRGSLMSMPWRPAAPRMRVLSSDHTCTCTQGQKCTR